MKHTRTLLFSLGSLLLLAGAAVADEWSPTGWQLLGERMVNGKRDKDTIKVGRYEGKFDQITIVAADNDVEIVRLVVHFANRTKFKPSLRHYFKEGSRSRVIDLPGNDRTITKVEIVYKNVARRQKATVQIWGRDTRAGGGGGSTTPKWDPAGWDKLGERMVNGKRDKDTFDIGRDDGRFTKLTFVVEDSDVEIYDILITFGNGETMSPNTRLVFKEGSRSRAIDLPGEKRYIKKIDFRYGNLPGGGKATVVVYGKPAKS